MSIPRLYLRLHSVRCTRPRHFPGTPAPWGHQGKAVLCVFFWQQLWGAVFGYERATSWWIMPACGFKAFHIEEMLIQLSPQLCLEFALRLVAFWEGAGFILPLCSPLLQLVCSVCEQRWWSSRRFLWGGCLSPRGSTQKHYCNKCLPERLPDSADLCWFTQAAWKWKCLC